MDCDDQLDGQQPDNLPKDYESIEVISESGDSLIRDLEWATKSSGRSSDAESDVELMDFQKISMHSKMATLVHHDGRQFIERRDLEDGGLPYSAELYLNGEVWKLNGEDCLLLSHRRYIAEVIVEGRVDLEETSSFEEAARILLKHVKVVKVLQDKQLEECKKAKGVLQMILDKLASGSEENKRDIMELCKLIQKHGNVLNGSFTQNLKCCSNLSSDTMAALDSYVTKTLNLIQRDEILGRLNDSSISDDFINAAVRKALTIHRDRLAAICPPALMEGLGKLPDDSIMYVSAADINLFADLVTLDHEILQPVLSTIFSKFSTKVQNMNGNQLVQQRSLSSKIFLYICKSLLEVTEQLEVQTDNERVVVYSEEDGWEVICDEQEECQTPHSKHLRQQLQMIVALANHFEPGGPFLTSRFPYEFTLLQNMDAVPESVRIWLCLLDDSMKDLVQADSDKMEMLSCFFRSFVSFIASEQVSGETLECLRTITHEALRSMAGMQTSGEWVRVPADPGLLECNEMISRCLNRFSSEHFATDCDQIRVTLRRIIDQAMNRNVAWEEMTEFCRVFQQLLKDLSDVPLEWYLRLPPSEFKQILLRGRFVVLVDNRWTNTEHECLKVVDPDGFVKMYKLLYDCNEIPKHYQLKAIQMLLNALAEEQNFSGGKFLSDKYQLQAMNDMVNAIRNAIFYLIGQPDYSCFELYLQRMGEILNHLSTKERSIEGSDARMSTLTDAQATDHPRTDHADFGKALESLPDFLESSTMKEHSLSFEKYSNQLNKHLSETVGYPLDKRTEQIVLDVKSKIQPQIVTTWTEEFKRNELPMVLGGLSAVWYLIVSKNDCNSNKWNKPSNLQIDCILNLFDNQNPNDNDMNRLLYLSSHQGKDLVLGLTAAILALYGHKVLIACYNSSLARRRFDNLIKLFEAFSVQDSILFGSIEDAAREGSREMYNKFAATIHKNLGIESNAQVTNEKSILLIEDVDLLLQSKTLGRPFKRFVRPTIPGLALVQERFYSKEGRMTLSEINKFIDEANFKEICELRNFLSRPQTVTLLEFTAQGFVEKSYNNKTLFHNHVKGFTKNVDITKSKECRLSGNGVVMVNIIDDSRHDDLRYFKLNPRDFQQTVNNYKNYGFLTLGYVPFVYAHLLKNFSLVFGFASAQLDGYEELALHDHYGIYHKIHKLNPLERNSVEFDPRKDFLCVNNNNQWDWMISVMVATNVAIGRNCSVLVFFNNGRTMREFQQKFTSHLEQLCVVVIQTASKEVDLADDVIAVEEVTVLVIDRKGDLAEDRDIHVIQTFCSEDAVEEKLIRRQAERNHRSGSFELIVDINNLPVARSTKASEVTYKMIVKLRRERSFGDAMNRLNQNVQLYETVEKFYNKF